MTETNIHGPIDFVLLEFSGDKLTGRAAQALLDLVEAGIVRLYDVLVVGKAADGTTYGVDLAGRPARSGTSRPSPGPGPVCCPTRTCTRRPRRWHRGRWPR